MLALSALLSFPGMGHGSCYHHNADRDERGKRRDFRAAGTVVTLTATVVSGSTPVNPGQVKFCDATASIAKTRRCSQRRS